MLCSRRTEPQSHCRVGQQETNSLTRDQKTHISYGVVRGEHFSEQQFEHQQNANIFPFSPHTEAVISSL